MLLCRQGKGEQFLPSGLGSPSFTSPQERCWRGRKTAVTKHWSDGATQNEPTGALSQTMMALLEDCNSPTNPARPSSFLSLVPRTWRHQAKKREASYTQKLTVWHNRGRPAAIQQWHITQAGCSAVVGLLLLPGYIWVSYTDALPGIWANREHRAEASSLFTVLPGHCSSPPGGSLLRIAFAFSLDYAVISLLVCLSQGNSLALRWTLL